MSDALAVAIGNPLRMERVFVPVVEGTTFADVVCQLAPGQVARLAVNGVPVPLAQWGERVRDGDHVEIRAVPAGGKFWRMLLVMAVVTWAGAFGGRMAAKWGIHSALGKGLVKGAFTALGLMAINALVPVRNNLPALSGTSNEESTQYGIAGARNLIAPYGVIPWVLGYHRMTPPYGAQPYTEIVGADQYLRCLFAIGYGPVEISDVKIGSTAIGSFADVTTESKEGAAGDTAVTLYPATVHEESVGASLTSAGGWVTRTTEADTDEITVDVEFPAGLATYVNGVRTARMVAIAVEYREHTGPGSWIDVTNHHLAGLTVSVAGGGYTLGWAAASFAGGGGSGAAGDCYGQWPGGSISAARHTANGSGYSATGPTVTPAGGGAGATITPVMEDGYPVISATAQPYRYAWHWTPAARGEYDVRVRRVTADTTDPNIVDGCTWTILRSIKNEDPVEEPRMAKYAVRIRASNQLNGVIDELNCLVKSKCLDWNAGTSTWVERATQNPASLFRHLLQGPGNQDPVADARIDLTTLAAWHVECAAAGYTCNLILDTQDSLWERLCTVAACGRASPTRVSGVYSVIRDTVRTTPVQLFTNRNTRNLQYAQAFHVQPHALRCRFIDQDNDYVQDERIVYDDGYTALTATRFEEASFPGVTDPELVWKHARYALAVQRLRPAVYSFETDVEGLVCTRGDLVRLVHDVPLMGVASARVVSATADALTLDSDVTLEAGTDYGVLGRAATGVITQWDIVCDVGTRRQVRRVSTEPVFTVAAGDLVVIGVRGSEAADCLVESIEYLGDLGARVNLVDYAAAVYTADSGAIPAYTAQSWYPENLRPVVPPVDLTCTEYLYRDAGVLRYGCTLSWSYGTDNRIPEGYDVAVQWPGTDTWQAAGTTTGTALDVPWTAPGAYSFRVRARTGARSSEWVELASQTVDDLAAAPDDVTGLRMVYVGGKIALAWDEVDDVRDVAYELRYGTVWGTGVYVGTVTETTHQPATAGTYMVKAVCLGAYSNTEASIEIEGTILVANVVDTTTEHTAWTGTLATMRRQIPTSWNLYENMDADDLTLRWVRTGVDHETFSSGVCTIINCGADQDCFDRTYPTVSWTTATDLWVLAELYVASGCDEDDLTCSIALKLVTGTHAYVCIVFGDDGIYEYRSLSNVLRYACDMTTEKAVVIHLTETVLELFVDGALVWSGAPATSASGNSSITWGKRLAISANEGQYWSTLAYVAATSYPGIYLDGADGLTGTYTTATANRVDIGYEAQAKVTATWQAWGVDADYDLLLIEDLLLEEDLLDGTQDIEVVAQVRTAGDDAVYGDWAPLQVGDYYARYVDFRLAVAVNDEDVTAYVDECEWSVDMPDRIDSGTVSAAAGGTAVTFSPAFQAAPQVVGTILSCTAGDDLKITSVATTGFTVQVLNGGAGAARTVYWVAKGY